MLEATMAKYDFNDPRLLDNVVYYFGPCAGAAYVAHA